MYFKQFLFPKALLRRKQEQNKVNLIKKGYIFRFCEHSFVFKM